MNHAHALAPSLDTGFAGTTPVATSKARRWTGRTLSGLAILFLAFDTVIKLVLSGPAVASMAELGYPPGALLTIGLIELGCLIAYVVPRTAILGAVLFTGYLGGAIATHLRLGNPLFSHTLFPIYVAALLWGGLYLRDGRLRRLLGRAA